MGNTLWNSSPVKTDIPIIITPANPILDDFDKSELAAYIKSNRPKNINLPENFRETMKSVELENTKLIPMSIELYEQLIQIFGEFVKDFTQSNPREKKAFFVRPKFGIEEITKSVDIAAGQYIDLPLNTDIFVADPILVTMKTGEITLDEYNASFNNIISKKDMVGISKRILRDMPNYLKIRFINVFNQHYLQERTATTCIAKGSYVYKASKRGPTTDVNSFRTILAVPNVINQFHRILNMRISDYMLQNRYLDTNIQKGGITGQKFSVFEQFFKLKNVLKHSNKHKNSAVILFLDITNAFGNINLRNLYQILKLYQIDSNCVTYLESFYENLEYYIDIPAAKTNLFKWTNGLIQGCSLSPIMFVIAMNYILTHIDKKYKNNLGYDFGNGIQILLTAFVDDISIVCKDVVSAQIVFDEFNSLCKMLGLTVGLAKCAMMVVNDPASITEDCTSFSGIKRVNTFKYLGEYLSVDGTSTESYAQFIQILVRKLRSIDIKQCAIEQKAVMFNELVPWIQRKTMLMYDIDTAKRIKIISIIKSYTDKWNINDFADIFYNVSSIISESTDTVIHGLVTENIDSDTELEHDVEIANYVFKDTNIRFEYSQIDDEFELDAEIEDLYRLTNK